MPTGVGGLSLPGVSNLENVQKLEGSEARLADSLSRDVCIHKSQ
jgi:hypothetical protein